MYDGATEDIPGLMTSAMPTYFGGIKPTSAGTFFLNNKTFFFKEYFHSHIKTQSQTRFVTMWSCNARVYFHNIKDIDWGMDKLLHTTIFYGT